MKSDTAELWARFEDTPRDMGLLAIIADHYRDSGSDEYAECLQWCAEKTIKTYCFGGSHRITAGNAFYDYFLNMELESDSYPRDARQYLTGTASIRDAYLLLCRHWYAVIGAYT